MFFCFTERLANDNLLTKNRTIMQTKTLFVSALLLLGASATQAKIKMFPLFTDNMVLQQNTKAPIWGEAKAGKNVKVTTSWNNRTYTVKADSKGRWRIDVDTPSAGGPYEVSVSDGKPVVLRDVMIGEVWLCTGQSNMQMPMEGWNIKMNAEEIASSASTTNVRLMHIDNAVSQLPTAELPKQKHTWEKCSPETVKSFSATGYFFGKNLAASRGVPVGLIMTCWGGTDIESWMSGKALSEVPGFKTVVDEIVNDKLTPAEHETKYLAELNDWFTTTGKKEGSVGADGKVLWAAPDYDDTAWQLLPQPLKIDEVGYTSFDGVVWYRKTVDVPEAWQGKELKLELSTIDDIDVTYFNGQAVGHTETCPVKRVYTIPADMVKAGRAVIAVRVLDVGSAGGLRGNADNMALSCGSDRMSLGGEWRMKLASDLNAVAKVPVNPVDNPFIPTVLYNAMIRPLVPYAVKGAIWYQGENNAPRAYRYRDLLPQMIASWRNDWNSQFPFLIVQLANYMQRKDQPAESEWAELREAQLLTSETVAGSGLAVAVDVGLADDIHPTDKQTVGQRLSLVARHVAYGENIASSGPLYQSHKIEGGAIRLTFAHVDGGLKVRGGDKLTGFAIAGADHKFHWADARIEGNDIVVSSADVPMPLAVRYAWADNPDCNLYNGAGLPASPFRTDAWEGLTVGR